MPRSFLTPQNNIMCAMDRSTGNMELLNNFPTLGTKPEKNEISPYVSGD